MYSTENRQCLWVSKFSFLCLQKQIDEHLPNKQTVQDHSDHRNCPSCFQVVASGGIKEKYVSVICCCFIPLWFRPRKSALKQREVRYENGNGIENVTENCLRFLSIQTLSRLFHSSQVETHFSILLHRHSSSQGNLHLGKFTSLWLRKAKETHKRVSVFKVPSSPL